GARSAHDLRDGLRGPCRSRVPQAGARRRGRARGVRAPARGGRAGPAAPRPVRLRDAGGRLGVELGLAGRRAIVTGSSKGIGRAVAATLVAEGARVTLCARGARALEAAAAEIDPSGERVRAVAADLATEEGVERVWQAHAAAFGGVDVLVN